LIALPFLCAPTLLGIEIQQRVARGLGNAELLAYVTTVVIAYVIACCWIAIRSVDPLHDFRRFPFRGSLLSGAIAGAVFGLQFALGYGAAHAVRGQDDVETILAMLISMSIRWTAYGVLGGAYLGMVAGVSYCVARRFLPGLSNRAVVRKRLMEKYDRS
jgi:hypothetical protein